MDATAVYNTLNCCPVTINDWQAGHRDSAGTAWYAAARAAIGAFPEGSDGDDALIAITDAAGLWHASPRSWLANALDATCHAVSWAIGGSGSRVADAEAAVARLDPELAAAFTVILGEVRALAETGVPW